MEIKYTGMELKLHRHGIRTALASVFRGDADRHAARRRQRIGERHCDGKSLLVPPVDGADGDRDGCDGMAWREEKHPVCIAGRIVAPLCRDHARDIRPAARSRTRKTAFGGQLVVLWFLLRYFLTEAPFA